MRYAWLPAEQEAQEEMPFTNGMSREEIRLVSCPACGAGSTDKCSFPNKGDMSVRRHRPRIHKRRIEKAVSYRAEHRI